jgi:hypothetical protein
MYLARRGIAGASASGLRRGVAASRQLRLARAFSSSPMVVVEHNDGAVAAGTLHALTAATVLSPDVSVLVAGTVDECAAASKQMAEFAAVRPPRGPTLKCMQVVYEHRRSTGQKSHSQALDCRTAS